MWKVALIIWAIGLIPAAAVSIMVLVHPYAVMTQDQEETAATWKLTVYPLIWPCVLVWVLGESFWLSIKGRRMFPKKSVST